MTLTTMESAKKVIISSLNNPMSRMNYCLVSLPGMGKSQNIISIPEIASKRYKRTFGYASIAINTANEGDLLYALPNNSADVSATVENTIFKDGREVVLKKKMNSNSNLSVEYVLNKAFSSIIDSEERRQLLLSKKTLTDEEKEELTLLPEQWIVFLDELNRGATRHISNEFMRILTEHELGGKKLPENITYLAAMNPSGQMEDIFGQEIPNMGVQELDFAVSDRFNFIYLKPDVKEWSAWANAKRKDAKDTDIIKSNVHPDLVLFFNEHKDLFATIGKDNKMSSPRSITWLSNEIVGAINSGQEDLVKDTEVFRIWAGQLGEEVSTSLTQFWFQKSRKPLPNVEDLFKDDSVGEAELPKQFAEEADQETGKNARRFILIQNITSYAMDHLDELEKNGRIKRFATFILKCPMDYQFSAIREITISTDANSDGGRDLNMDMVKAMFTNKDFRDLFIKVNKEITEVRKDRR